MQINDYQADARSTCLESAKNLPYLICGLSAETGEVAGKFAKYIRDRTEFYKLKEDLVKELGDVLWFVAIIADDLGVSLSEVAQQNIDKIYSRLKRGALKGSGDER